MLGYPTPLMKIGKSLLCMGSSTQIQHLYIICPNIHNDHTGSHIQLYRVKITSWAPELYSQHISQLSNIIHHMSKRPLGPITNAHKTSQLYIIVTRVNVLLLYNTYIKMKNILIHAKPSKPHSGFLLNDLYDACTCKIVSLDRVS